MDNGVFYDKFIVMHPRINGPGFGEYELNGQYDSFTATIGIGRTHNCAGGPGSVIFIVKVDGIQKYASSVITTAQDETINVPVSGGDILKIEAYSSIHGEACDIAVYANPVLTAICGGMTLSRHEQTIFTFQLNFECTHLCRCFSSTG